MRSVKTGVTDQTIVVHCFDSDEAAVTLTSGSAGLAISYRVDSAGREGTPVSMTPVTRLVANQHRDGAITSKGDGKHEIDLPDAAFASAGFVSVILTATDVTGRVYSEIIAIGQAVELDSARGAQLDQILEDTGTTLPGLINAIEGGGSGSGTGARTVTITVNDGTTVLQNATVRMTEGANTFTALTNASGVAVFNLDDATYTVGITKAGYSYSGTTLVVDGTETATYSMTLVSVTPPTDPDLSAIEVLCLGTNFTAESGIAIDFRMAEIPSGDQNSAYPGAKATVTSNGSGIARWEAPQGAVVEYKRGNTQTWSRATLDSDSVTSVTSVIGSP